MASSDWDGEQRLDKRGVPGARRKHQELTAQTMLAVVVQGDFSHWLAVQAPQAWHARSEDGVQLDVSNSEAAQLQREGGRVLEQKPGGFSGNSKTVADQRVCLSVLTFYTTCKPLEGRQG